MKNEKDQVLCEYLRADWLRLVDILLDLIRKRLSQKDKKVKPFWSAKEEGGPKLVPSLSVME